jgi:hypothetical protein
VLSELIPVEFTASSDYRAASLLPCSSLAGAVPLASALHVAPQKMTEVLHNVCAASITPVATS